MSNSVIKTKVIPAFPNNHMFEIGTIRDVELKVLDTVMLSAPSTPWGMIIPSVTLGAEHLYHIYQSHKINSSANTDCFDLIKIIINQTPPSFSDSCIKLKSSENGLNISELKKCTECSASAYYMVRLLTGIEPEVMHKRNIKVTCEYPLVVKNGNCLSTSEEFFGTYEKLMSMKSDGTYEHDLAEKIFAPSKEFQHQLFCVTLGGGSHIFVIEKKANAVGKAMWRIYQSWYSCYSLAEWLGIETWKCDNTSFTKMHSVIGNGKMLSEEEFLFFFRHPIDIDYEIAKNVCIYIKAFIINPNIGAILQKKL